MKRFIETCSLYEKSKHPLEPKSDLPCGVCVCVRLCRPHFLSVCLIKWPSLIWLGFNRKHHCMLIFFKIHVTTHQERGNFQRLWQHHLINRLVCTARACEPSLYKAAETRTHRHLPLETMRAAAISTPRLDKMPGMLLSANPKELKATDHSLPDDKTQKKRPKTL